jgi:hypothetical protein
MKKFAILIVVIMMLGTISGSVFAYDNISGTVRDSKTTNVWTHGGSVTIWRCDDINGTALATGSITAGGNISVAYTAQSTGTPICVEIGFNDGGNGTPADVWKVFVDDGAAGNYAMGNIFTDTGPTAVTMSSFGSANNTMSLSAMAAIVLLLVGGTFVVWRRRDNA